MFVAFWVWFTPVATLLAVGHPVSNHGRECCVYFPSLVSFFALRFTTAIYFLAARGSSQPAGGVPRSFRTLTAVLHMRVWHARYIVTSRPSFFPEHRGVITVAAIIRGAGGVMVMVYPFGRRGGAGT